MNRIFFQVGGGHWVWPPAEIIIIINNKEVRFFLFLCLIGTLVGRGGRAARGLAEARNKIFIYTIL